MNTKTARDRRAARLQKLRAADFDRPPTPTPPVKLHAPDSLPDPWLMDSEALLREIDRIRELANHIPLHGDAAYRAADTVVHALWKLREDLRFLIALHRDGQRRFAQRAEQLKNNTDPKFDDAHSRHGGRALTRSVA
jgi:hypothetical protein